MTGKEVQKHGFVWENEVKKYYGLTDEQIASIKYTSKYDIPKELTNINISIKTTCSPNTVCMADCLRVYDSDCHLIVIQYKQVNTHKHIKDVIQVDLTNARNLLFGDIERSELETLDRLVKQVPQKRKPTKEEHTAMYSYRNMLQKKGGAIQLNIKCNSQQSRLQCSFNKFQLFLQQNPERVIEQTIKNSLTQSIHSLRRSFKK